MSRETGVMCAKSAVFFSLFGLSARRLRGLGGLLGFGGHLDLVLFVRGGSGGILRDEGVRLFGHGERRQEQRRQNESAGNTHTVGHLLNLLAWQVLFGAGKDKALGRKEKERIHERTVTQRAKIARGQTRSTVGPAGDSGLPAGLMPGRR
ncbi:hypothetical protein EMIT0194P_50110 [Pseudomonas serbica]